MRPSLFNPSVQAIMEELQGSNMAAKPGAMPTPGKPGTGKNPAAQVAAGVQQVANQATAAQQGVDQLHQDVSGQQGIDPKLAAQVNANLKAQPKPTRPPASAQARAVQNDATANRNSAMQGKRVQAAEALESAVDKAITETEETPPVPAGTETKLTSPDDGGEDYNEQDPTAKRAKERAAEISKGSAGPKETSTMSVDGKKKGQGHHEVTNDKQCVTKKCEESEAGKPVFTEAERASMLDGIFG